MQLDIVNNENKKVGSFEIRDDVFGGRVNQDLVWESVVRANAGDRRGTHKTKNRANVSGSGKKPWRQKGTGRARPCGRPRAYPSRRVTGTTMRRWSRGRGGTSSRGSPRRPQSGGAS